MLSPKTIKFAIDIVRKSIGDIIQCLVIDSRCRFRIVDIQPVSRISSTTGNEYGTILVHVSTNSREVLSGISGTNPVYLSAFFDGVFSALLGPEVVDRLAVALDISEDRCADFRHPTFIPLEQALQEELVLAGSPIHNVAVRYGLRYVSIYGSTVIGPSPDTITALAYLFEHRLISSVLDLYCGTAAVALVARQLGAQSTCSVDLFADAPPQLKPLLAPNNQYRSCRVEDFVPDAKYSLCVMDPFPDAVPSAVVSCLPRLSAAATALLVNLGWRDRKRTVAHALSVLKEFYPRGDLLQVADSVLYYGQREGAE